MSDQPDDLNPDEVEYLDQEDTLTLREEPDPLPDPQKLFENGNEPTRFDLVQHQGLDFIEIIADEIWEDANRREPKFRWKKMIEEDRTWLPRSCRTPAELYDWFDKFRALYRASISRQQEVYSVSALVRLQENQGPKVLLGKDRWLCEGGSCIWNGSSGIGKSTLTLQAAVRWALNKDFFGVMPSRPLRSLIIQAENDPHDIKQMLVGTLKGYNLLNNERDYLDDLDSNLKIIPWDSSNNGAFKTMVENWIEEYVPDLVWIDPLLSFVDGDVSEQEVISEFLRRKLGPIARKTKVCWMIIHHTGKAGKGRKPASTDEYMYAGFGSSELTNWPRAINYIGREGDSYKLVFSKRGGRAGAKLADGTESDTINLRHHPDYMFWEELPPDMVESTSASNSIKSTPARGVSTKFRNKWLFEDFKKLYDPSKSSSENKKYIAANLKPAYGPPKIIDNASYMRLKDAYEAAHSA